MTTRRVAILLAVLALPAARAGADDPPKAPQAPATPKFWTDAELALIDRGLEVLNLERKDLGFQKRPIDDPFRLSVVDRALDDPLSVGGEAQGWDDVARKGDARALFDAAVRSLDLALPTEAARFLPALDLDAPGLPAPALAALRETWAAIAFARERAEEAAKPWAERADSVLRKALRTQVEKPEVVLPGADMDDEEFLPAIRKADRLATVRAGRELLSSVAGFVEALRASKPSGTPYPPGGLRFSMPTGLAVITGTGDDVHEEGDDAVLVIDLGGNDTWKRGASAYGKRRISVCIDLSGDDRYVGRDDLSFGGALGGVAVQWDGGGNDLYDAGHASLGAGILGVGVLVDEGGDDVYRCKDFGLGAGAFGVGIHLDEDGNDLRHADLFGEGFASTWGCGVCVDLKGQDVYDSGGTHSDAPLHRDRFQTLSQGFAIGMRPDASGGVGVLVDVEGNDRYAADVYGQGASYWFSLGLLIDDDGNDTYVCGHYGQGAGIHLSAGMLLDRAGQDLYYTEYGVGIGGAHDFAVGLLVDRGGDDHYCGSGGSQGGALTNSVAILLDGAGDDGYTAVRTGSSHGSAAPARDTGGIGLFLDAGGKDVYSESDRDGKVRAQGAVGAGLDEPSPPDAPPAADPMAAKITKEEAKALVDRDGTVPGPDGKPPVDDLDKLWAIAIRWQVGDERVIGPVARERLVALGKPTLDRMMERLGSKDGLEVEAIQALLPSFPRADVLPRLLEATRSSDVATRRSALVMLGNLKASEAEGRLVELLADAEVRRYAMRTLAAIGKAPPEVAGFLRGPKELDGVAAVVCLGAVGDIAAVDALASALAPDVPFLVRMAAEQRLAALGETAVPVLARVAREGPTVRERRSALRALGGTRSATGAQVVIKLLLDPDPWVRLCALLAAGHLLRDLSPGPVADVLEIALAYRAELEEDPMVRRALERPREPVAPSAR